MNLWRPSPQPRIDIGITGGGLFPQRVLFGPDDLARHKHVMGVSGFGKSKFLASLFVQLFKQGVGCAVIDPHRDLCIDILALLADDGYFRHPNAFERLWYLDFSRTDAYVPFNILSQPHFTPEDIAHQVLDVCQRVWRSLGDGAAPRFENIVLPAIVTLTVNGQPITELHRLLVDRDYRERLLAHVPDRQVVAFFHDRYDRWGREAPMMTESTENRAFLLTFSKILRYTLGQPDNRLNFRQLMDNGVSVLCNLSGLQAKTQQFLGALLAVGFEHAALSRDDVPPAQRRPYHLLIDEWANFAATTEDALSHLLSQARKYQFVLTLSHQTWGQASEHLQSALQNCLTVFFRLGPEDAAWAARRLTTFDPYLVKHDTGDDARVPLYFSLTEQQQAVVTALTRLAPGEAVLKPGADILTVKTKRVPATRTTADELRRITDRYARLLHTPADEVIPLVDGATETVSAPPSPSRLRRSGQAPTGENL